MPFYDVEVIEVRETKRVYRVEADNQDDAIEAAVDGDVWSVTDPECPFDDIVDVRVDHHTLKLADCE